MKRPTGPALGDLKVWTSVVFVLVTSRALWISSFSVTRTPRPRLSGAAAILTAFRRLSGPSAPIAVAGRMAPTSTTGLSVATVRSRKNAVSSIVSVPWVTTTPPTAWSLTSSSIRLSSLSQTWSFMSWLPMLAICSPLTCATPRSSGTASMMASTASWPAV